MKIEEHSVLLNLSISNGPGEAVDHNREVGGEPHKALVREARAGRELAIIFEGYRSTQKQ